MEQLETLPLHVLLPGTIWKSTGLVPTSVALVGANVTGILPRLESLMVNAALVFPRSANGKLWKLRLRGPVAKRVPTGVAVGVALIVSVGAGVAVAVDVATAVNVGVGVAVAVSVAIGVEV